MGISPQIYDDVGDIMDSWFRSNFILMVLPCPASVLKVLLITWNGPNIHRYILINV